jgi:Tol biopolymer transport system component
MKKPERILYLFVVFALVAVLSSKCATSRTPVNSTPTQIPTQMASPTAMTIPSPSAELHGTFAMEIRGDIWVMNGDGSGRRQLTSGPGIDFDPHWSPDGKQIVFRTERGVRGPDLQSTGFDSLFIVNVDGSGEHQLYPPDANTVGGLFPSWGSNNLIAFSGLPASGTGETIYTIHPDGTGLNDLGHPEGGIAEIAKWSPDSSKIAFESHQGDGRWEIWVMNADGSDKKQLTFNTKIPGGQSGDHLGAWSPDGKRMVFSSDHEGDWEVYVMNADGTDVKRLTHLPDSQEPEEWFQDDWILVNDWSASKNTQDWILMKADGTDIVPVPQLEGVSAPMDWRP